MKQDIKQYCKKIGLEYCAVAPNPEGPGSAVVCLLPYFTGDFSGDISIYARGADYHKVAQQYMGQVNEYMRGRCGNDYQGRIFCDNSPYSDRSLAFKAGLGIRGLNGCLINEKYGSFVFICYILTNIALEPDRPSDGVCTGCGRCIAACPGNALDRKGNLDIARCASAISQKKGVLSASEAEILRKSGSVWGCDTCQRVCPHNEGVSLTKLPEFKTGLVSSLDFEHIKGLSNREFARQYRNRAFSWRGRAVLLRNGRILGRTQ